MTAQRSPQAALLSRFVCGCAAVLMAGCGSTVPFTARNGSLDLNPRLRGDFQASSAMQDGRFYSDGNCPSSADQNDECHFISTLRNSLISSTQLQHLRRSQFFWMESDGFPEFSYEVVARNFDLLSADNSANVIASNVSVGSCVSFPFADPDTRLPLPALGQFNETNSKRVAQQFDITIHECAAPIAGANPEALSPITNNCTDQSVQQILSRTPLPAAPNPPLCLTNMGVDARMMADLSYTLTPGPAPGLNMQDFQKFWPNLAINPLPVGPHLKVVPVNGTRTISRQMAPGAAETNPDGSTIFHWTWTVPVQNDLWKENFSPNIVVVKARLRKGPWVSGNAGNYLPMTRLDIGRFRCGDVSAPPVTEFAIQMCELNMRGGLHVTPTYEAGAFQQTPIDDDVRLLWEAQVHVPAGSTLVSASDEVSLELDLTAVSVIGSSGAGLLANPPNRDFGLIRTHASSVVQPAFTVQSIGTLAAQIDSIALAGPNAAEFGPAQIHLSTVRRAVIGTAPTPITQPALLAPPFLLQSGASVSVDLPLAFQTIGLKQAQLVITMEDVRFMPQTLILPVSAIAVTPDINVEPQQLYFYTAPNSAVGVSAERVALMSNDGPLPFARQSLSITGHESSDFRLIRAEYGLAQSNLSQPLTVDPGQSETYQLGFYPTAAGDRQAVLTIRTSEGDFTIPLFGHCDGICRQPPPAPTYHVRAPPPYVVFPQIKRK